MADLDFAAAYQKELQAFERDSQEATQQIREHGQQMQATLMNTIGRRGQAPPDPLANLPKEQREAIQAINAKLLQFPMLTPYILAFITEKLTAVSTATQAALGPLPQPPSP